MICNSPYGNYRTRKFTDIWPKVEDFLNDYNNNGIKTTVSQENTQTLYYLLYSKYGNSHIASSDENQFKYKVFTTIFAYGPTWEKRLEIQETLRGLTQDELLQGSKQISNHGYNPSSEPSTATLEELITINEQNTSQYKKSKLDAYTLLIGLLETDVSMQFINRFKDLFLKIVQPQLPLWYITDTQEEDI